ncbi:SRPBCC family protein [Nesterenkonia sandarakina]|uniref:Putative membrane protein n=1 Tax=Nesterenkonia sandarakina TaxID=272918 RepID=A0A7Z0E6W3_9MICC|nr:SRPBCC family protein [Nesterenkonia sandarakina]NYJ15497.1 putative membrane protein [Nesterenkonia sandarakina]
MATRVEGTIVVQAPISAVYTRWTQFEEFPQFMGGVISVRFLTDNRLEWVAEPEGVRQQWEAEVLELVPDQKVSWAGVDGAVNSGTATFTETDEAETEIHLVCEYQLPDQEEAPGGSSSVEVVRNSAQKDLQKFKELVEDSGGEAEVPSEGGEEELSEPSEPTG